MITSSNVNNKKDEQQFLSDIDQKIEEIKRSDFPSAFSNPFPLTRINYAHRIDHTILAKGLLYKAKGKIDPVNQTIAFNVQIMTFLKLITLFIVALLVSILFIDNVTMNGNQNPALGDKLEFVALGIISFSIPTYLVYRYKKRFKINVEKIFLLA